LEEKKRGKAPKMTKKLVDGQGSSSPLVIEIWHEFDTWNQLLTSNNNKRYHNICLYIEGK